MACDSALWSDVERDPVDEEKSLDLVSRNRVQLSRRCGLLWPAKGSFAPAGLEVGIASLTNVADGMTVGHPCLGNFLPQCCGEAGEGLAGGDLLHLEASLLTVAVAAVLLGADATVHTHIGTHKHHDDKTRINP